MDRPPVCFIAWSPAGGRASEIAAALGGEGRCFYHRRLVRRSLVPIRYAVSAVQTIGYLVRRRPEAVIATNPPIFPGLLAYAYGRAAGAPVLLDSHPSSFGRKENRMARLLLPVHAWLAARATSTMVTTDALAQQIAAWGGDADIVHEAPPEWPPMSERALAALPTVLFVGVFDADEPVAEVLKAAHRCARLRVRITGDLRRCPSELRAAAPANVEFTGYLPADAYREAVEQADVVLTLTTEPTSVMRAAYEAVYARRPLVTSDWPPLRRLFPYAVHVANDAAAIAAGLQDAVRRHAELIRVAPAAAELQQARWEGQLAALRDRVGQTGEVRAP